jgi:hypothetical protein
MAPGILSRAVGPGPKGRGRKSRAGSSRRAGSRTTSLSPPACARVRRAVRPDSAILERPRLRAGTARRKPAAFSGCTKGRGNVLAVEAAGTTLFGKYLLHERISSGGRAEIWRATRRAATGSWSSAAAADPGQGPRAAGEFIREAKIRCSSPTRTSRRFSTWAWSTATSTSSSSTCGRQPAPGAAALPRPGMVPHDLAAFMAAGLCDALDHVHRKGGPTGEPLHLVHRDVPTTTAWSPSTGRSSSSTSPPPPAWRRWAPRPTCPRSSSTAPGGPALGRLLAGGRPYEALTGRRLYSRWPRRSRASCTAASRCCRQRATTQDPRRLERIVSPGSSTTAPALPVGLGDGRRAGRLPRAPRRPRQPGHAPGAHARPVRQGGRRARLPRGGLARGRPSPRRGTPTAPSWGTRPAAASTSRSTRA